MVEPIYFYLLITYQPIQGFREAIRELKCSSECNKKETVYQRKGDSLVARYSSCLWVQNPGIGSKMLDIAEASDWYDSTNSIKEDKCRWLSPK